MGLGDKARHTDDEIVGKAERDTGKVLDDKSLEARGIAEESASKGTKAVDDVIEAAERTDDAPEDQG